MNGDDGRLLMQLFRHSSSSFWRNIFFRNDVCVKRIFQDKVVDGNV